MRRHLVLLRHAKSDWDSGADSDFERPLSPRGRKAAPRIGAWLLENNRIPDLILSSPAERARQTALAVAKPLGIDLARIRWDGRIYEATGDTLLSLLGTLDNRYNCALLVGHNPGLEDLLVSLCAEDVPAPADGKLLPTAAAAVLGLDTGWDALAPDAANLFRLVRPRELRR